MNSIKQIFVDSLNGLSLDLIPLFLFQLFSAALMAYALDFLLKKKSGEHPVEYAVLLTVGITLLTSLAKYSVALSVIGAALILLFARNKERNPLQTIALLLFALVGFGCGSASVIQTMIGFVVICLIIVFIPIKTK
ncbi:MAG: hypothetical protein IPM74_06375 [Crocinitomicaceae bacterium]|nr:hypothetical protein [Crocinitomicaceae bacterium]